MGQLFEELKRRSVFKVAAAYVVVGWVLVQVANEIAPMLSLPDTSTQHLPQTAAVYLVDQLA